MQLVQPVPLLRRAHDHHRDLRGPAANPTIGRRPRWPPSGSTRHESRIAAVHHRRASCSLVSDRLLMTLAQ